MDREASFALSTIEKAIYWRQIYADILEMQKVLNRIRALIAIKSRAMRDAIEHPPLHLAEPFDLGDQLMYFASRWSALWEFAQASVI